MLGCKEHDCCLGNNCAQVCWTIYDARLKVIEQAIQYCDRNPNEAAELRAAIAQLQELEKPPAGRKADG